MPLAAQLGLDLEHGGRLQVALPAADFLQIGMRQNDLICSFQVLHASQEVLGLGCGDHLNATLGKAIGRREHFGALPFKWRNDRQVSPSRGAHRNLFGAVHLRPGLQHLPLDFLQDRTHGRRRLPVGFAEEGDAEATAEGHGCDVVVLQPRTLDPDLRRRLWEVHRKAHPQQQEAAVGRGLVGQGGPMLQAALQRGVLGEAHGHVPLEQRVLGLTSAHATGCLSSGS
mmetsp:Transcript_2398/g.9397  ORF Transcript_2398/g.9397 Transcript_2398/m.9397 type:complete len:227 (-) Transcript_2398:857-1537(-)